MWSIITTSNNMWGIFLLRDASFGLHFSSVLHAAVMLWIFAQYSTGWSLCCGVQPGGYGLIPRSSLAVLLDWPRKMSFSYCQKAQHASTSFPHLCWDVCCHAPLILCVRKARSPHPSCVCFTSLVFAFSPRTAVCAWRSTEVHSGSEAGWCPAKTVCPAQCSGGMRGSFAGFISFPHHGFEGPVLAAGASLYGVLGSVCGKYAVVWPSYSW